jgi:hypothetical protein
MYVGETEIKKRVEETMGDFAVVTDVCRGMDWRIVGECAGLSCRNI